MRSIILFIVFIAGAMDIFSQTVFEPAYRYDIYRFLDELAAEKIIVVQSQAKPYSRKYIVEKLITASDSSHRLSRRQMKELQYYLRDYGLDAGLPFDTRASLIRRKNLTVGLSPAFAHYRDSSFTLSVRPVWGRKYYIRNNCYIYHNSGGAEAFTYAGKHIGLYASLVDNYQKDELWAAPSYLTLEPGGSYKYNVRNRKGGDYSEMRGGVTYSWRWGHIGLIKDQIEWGGNYHGSNILSGRNPSFAQLKLMAQPVSWLQLDYFHGWLVSEVLDSNHYLYYSQGYVRTRYRPKYMAANMLTFSPWKRLQFSAGNSIVYDIELQPAYFIPVMVYKSVDHTLHHSIDNMNSQFFVAVSSRQIKHLHLYGSWFVDEFSVTRVKDRNRRNFTSTKAGFRLSGLPLKDMFLTGEFTRTFPITYKHRVPTLTYASNQFSLGHYLGDNSREYFCSLEYHPLHTLILNASWQYAVKGNQYEYLIDKNIDTRPFLKDVIWQSIVQRVGFRWQIIYNTFVFAEYVIMDYKGFDAGGLTATDYLDIYTPSFFHGYHDFVYAGITIGW